MTVLADVSTPIIMGILLGGLYTLIALGLSLVFGVMKVINVAHGDWVILGSYFAYTAMTMLGLDPFLSLVMGIPLLFGIGFAVQRFLLNRAFAVSLDAALLVCFGISIIFQNFCQIIWTPFSRGLRPSYALESFIIGGLHVPLVYILDFIAAFIMGMAGAAFYSYGGYIEPVSAFNIRWLLVALLSTVIGGEGIEDGPIIGAAIVVLLHFLLARYAGISLIIQGIILVSIMLAAPQGIMGFIRKVRASRSPATVSR